MPAPNRTEQQASFKALKRFSRKQKGGELRGRRLAVLIAEAPTGHAGGGRGCEADHLEPFYLREDSRASPAWRLVRPPAAETSTERTVVNCSLPVLLELHHIEKRYGGVAALTDGNLAVDRGQVHLLLGENGAGKSTLMKIIAGIVKRDAGQMMWQGREVHLTTPSEAAAIGISMVHQESLLAPHLTVAENLYLGREERLPFGWVKRSRMMEAASRLIAEHGFPLRADWRVEKLTPAGKQLVEICRAILHGSSLVIFDEPTSSLSGAEAAEVFRIVRTLRERNMGVIYITHRLDELKSVGDRVTILRDGKTVHTGPLAKLTTESIIHHMVGREISAYLPAESPSAG